MKKTTLKILVDPSNGAEDFEIWAFELLRNGKSHTCIDHSQILDDDDVNEGFIHSLGSGNVFPIRQGVCSILRFEDIQSLEFREYLSGMLSHVPKRHEDILRSYLDKLTVLSGKNSKSWCQDEMEYYDEAVSTPERRNDMVKNIFETNLWHIFMERNRYLLDELRATRDLASSEILEIGCGNARTVAKLMSPSENRFSYVGTDISFKRLLVAKLAIPDGEFIQCSALNLPFKSDCFNVSIAFGVLHHLQNPTLGLEEIVRVSDADSDILVHEPLEKTRKFLDYSWANKIKIKFETYEHSEHDNEVELQEIVEHIDAAGLEIKNKNMSGSILRTVLAMMINRIGILRRSEFVWRALIAADRVFLNIFCRKPNSLGPNSVYLQLGNR